MLKYRRRKRILKESFPETWRNFLLTHVSFYSALNETDRELFEKKIQIFLAEKKITGVDVEVDTGSELLIAASAIIPVFRIPDWEFDKLGEVLLYPDRFDEEFDFKNGTRDVIGMVVPQTSSLIISKPALFKGFERNDGTNTAIHEFMHKIDEEDGVIDGLPALMMNRDDIQEWGRVRASEIDKIKKGISDINTYALTGNAEFLAVTGEYFFEKPEIMKTRHPDLYRIMRKIFRHNTSALITSEVKQFIRKK